MEKQPGTTADNRIAKQVKSSLPFYAVGAVWVLYALLFPLYRVFDFIIVAALSVAVYVVLTKVLPTKTVYEEAPETPADTGDSAADDIINRGREELYNFKMLTAKVQSASAVASAEGICAVATQIYNYVKENPDAANHIRQISTYYLPTLNKLLRTYIDVETQQVTGPHMQETKKGVEEALETAHKAFIKQLDTLFSDEALDVSTDVTVMQSLIKQQGLNDDETMLL